METTILVTAEELAAMGRDAFQFELVRGRMVRMNPPNPDHGEVSLTIGSAVRAHVRRHRLGRVFVESGFTLELNPDTVRGPDVSFVRSDHPSIGSRTGFMRGAPTLAVEVKSPDDTRSALAAKAAEYLAAGTELVWIVNPETETVTVLAPSQPPQDLHMGETLDGGTTLPGFSLPLSEVFDH